MDSTKGTIKELFTEMGYCSKEMEINKPYNVLNLGYKIRSTDGFNRIKNIIRKNDGEVYRLVTKDYVLKGASNHAVQIKDINDQAQWVQFYNLVNLSPIVKVRTESGWQRCIVEPISKRSMILDLEVEKTHCYFSSGILSHNSMWGPNEITTGGAALRYYASIRMGLRKSTQIKESGETVGNKVKAIVGKNKVAPPFKVAEFDIYGDEGISLLSELIEFGREFEIIKKAGSWYTIGDEHRTQGEANLRALMLKDSGLLQTIENQIRENFGLPLRQLNLS